MVAGLGEARVRTGFNPSENALVTNIKSGTAVLINICADHMSRADGTAYELDGEKKRLWNLAMTAYEEAAMWAVKAATG